MNILDQIIADKRKEVELKKSIIPYAQLEKTFIFERKTNSLTEKLKNSKSGIIAEYKRRSPSKSVINQYHNVWDVAKGYEKRSADPKRFRFKNLFQYAWPHDQSCFSEVSIGRCF